ncbi:hypothetical protein Vafri_15157, partial [Volvox africanus]
PTTQRPVIASCLKGSERVRLRVWTYRTQLSPLCMKLRLVGSQYESNVRPLLKSGLLRNVEIREKYNNRHTHLCALQRHLTATRCTGTSPTRLVAAITFRGVVSSCYTFNTGMGLTEDALAAEVVGRGVWYALGAPPQELQLDFCLPTGQSFRWRRTGEKEYTGVIGNRLVCLRQLEDDVLYRVLARGQDANPAADAAVLHDYFNLDTNLGHLATGWAASCSRFREVSPHFPGARMLRQDPLECLFQFICSSNNHISRIHGMVERLCSSYGTPLETTTPPLPPPPSEGASIGIAAPASAGASPMDTDERDTPSIATTKPTKRRAARGPQSAAATAAGGSEVVKAGEATELSFYAFPTLEQLSKATEEDLRTAGFGYRARFIVGATQALIAKPGGGRAWLLGLRQVGLEEAIEALTKLPGIGPKVAACICLFSLDKHQSIPVDTHVWQIAVRYYCPSLRGKSLTKKIHGEIQQVFVERFGPYAGWAHNTLFISELASQQHRLPEHLRHAKTPAAMAIGSPRGRSRSQGRTNRNLEDDRIGELDESEGPGTLDVENGDSDDGGKATHRSNRGWGSGGAAAAVAEPQHGKRGHGRWQQQGQKKSVELTGTVVEVTATTFGSNVGCRSSGAEDATPVCSAVLDGQADVRSTPARRARHRGPPTGCTAEPQTSPQRKRAMGTRGTALRKPLAAGDYSLDDFDELLT